jgi:aminoglycoside 3-N-acetyltransferase
MLRAMVSRYPMMATLPGAASVALPLLLYRKCDQMSEQDVIARSSGPATTESLSADLRALGLDPSARGGRSGPVLVHAALSAIGWVVGGPQAVLHALIEATGAARSDGRTLVMPAFSASLSDPSGWDNPPVPESWWPSIRETMPAFDPARTPTVALGRLPELFRTWPGVVRSAHPSQSFAALGPHAAALFARDPLDRSFRDGPLSALYEMDADILFLGADFETCTAFHLAEVRSGTVREVTEGAPITRDGARVWVRFTDFAFEPVDDFQTCGRALTQIGAVRTGPVASGEASLFSFRTAVDFAETWFQENRPQADRCVGDG